MSKVEILGIKIDNFSLQEVLEKIKHFLNSKNQHYIVTPNPEFLVAAQTDQHFKEILNYADIAVADGVGLIKAARFLKQRLQRVTGVDLVWSICELAEQINCPVYLLGGKEGIAKQASENLKKNFASLIIANAESGGEINDPRTLDSDLIQRINNSQAQILFVAFGQVKQEKWIFYNLDKLRNIKVAIGVGGAFDYISETIPRAPRLIRQLGFEWLFRLIQQPSRYQRIFNATIIFSYLIIKKSLWNKFHRHDEKVDER